MRKWLIAIGVVWLVLCGAIAVGWVVLNLMPIVQYPPLVWWIVTIWGGVVMMILAIPGVWMVRAGSRFRPRGDMKD